VFQLNVLQWLTLILVGLIMVCAAGPFTARAVAVHLTVSTAAGAAVSAGSVTLAAAELAVVDSLLAAGDFAGAEARASALCDTAGDDPVYGWQAHQRLGVALLRAGRPAEALPHLEIAVIQAMDDPVGHQNLAAALMALDRRGRALAELQEAAALAPANAAIRLDLGQALLRFRFFAEALPELLAADRLCGECLQAARALATYHLEAGSAAEAVHYLERVMAAQPAREVRLALASAQLAAERPQATVQLLTALPEDELTATEYRLLLRADRVLGRSERARSWAQRTEAPDTFPREITTDGLFWAVVAELCQLGGFRPEALRAIDTAIALAPDNAVYRVNRAAVLQQLGRLDEAAREIERARAIDPDVVTDSR